MLLAQLFLSSLSHAKTICVDANAKTFGEGSCWAKPFLTLQEALDLGEQDKTIDEIWIAQGIYKPTKTYSPKDENGHIVIGGAISLKAFNPGITIDNTLMNYHDNPELNNQYLKTFQLVDNINLYGGFQGNEKSKSERVDDIKLHQTILDGALDEHQVWHVLTAGNDITKKGVTVTLDKLIVRNGNAISAPYYPTHFPLNLNEVPIYYHDDAGGLYIFTQSKITLNHMIFEHNAGIAGGAIYVEDGSVLKIMDSIFRNNVADNGGAINIRSGGPNEFSKRQESRTTRVSITNSDFINNMSFHGSAIFVNDTQSNPPLLLAGQNMSLNNCRFTNNLTLKTVDSKPLTISALSNIYHQSKINI